LKEDSLSHVLVHTQEKHIQTRLHFATTVDIREPAWYLS